MNKNSNDRKNIGFLGPNIPPSGNGVARLHLALERSNEAERFEARTFKSGSAVLIAITTALVIYQRQISCGTLFSDQTTVRATQTQWQGDRILNENKNTAFNTSSIEIGSDDVSDVRLIWIVR